MQNWIDPGNAGPLLANFVPPGQEWVGQRMNHLVAFTRLTDLPVLAMTALAD